MAKIDLGFDKGVQVTGSAGHGGTNINLGGAINAAGQVGNAFENVSRGIKHVSDSLFGIFNDLADTRNRQEFLEGQTAMFDLSSAENERFEERIRHGDFDGAGGLEMFKQEALKSQEKVKEAFSNWVSKNVTQSNTRKILNEQMVLDGKKNFAHLSGRFLAYDNERRFNLMKSQCDRAVEDGSMVNLNAAIKAYVGGGKDKDGNDIPRSKSQEFEDNLRKEYEPKLQNSIINSTLARVLNIQDDKERMAAIDGQIQIYRDILNGKIEDNSLSFITPEKAAKILGVYKNAKAHEEKSEALEELDFKKKRNDSLNYRLQKLIEADDKIYPSYEKNLFKFIKENTAFSPMEREEALKYVKNTLAAAKMERNKILELRQKEQIKAEKLRTGQFIENVLKGKNSDYSQEEKNAIALVKTAATDEFSLLDRDGDGKVVKTISQKKDAVVWKLLEGVANYDPKQDEDGSYARALYYQIEGIFDDFVSSGFTQEPTREAIEWNAMSGDAQKKFIESRYLESFTPNTIEHYRATQSVLNGSFDYEGERDKYLREIGTSLSGSTSPLIHNPELKNRLVRELGQKLGVYPDAKIKVDEVNSLLNPMVESVLGKKPSKLGSYQNSYLNEIKQGFVHAAMTAGLDSPEELSKWFKTSPYVSTFKERLRLIKDLDEDDSYDTSFSHIGTYVSSAPKLGSRGENVLENVYLKLRQNKKSEE